MLTTNTTMSEQPTLLQGARGKTHSARAGSFAEHVARCTVTGLHHVHAKRCVRQATVAPMQADMTVKLRVCLTSAFFLLL